MKGSRCIYYQKHRTRTWIRESHKVTKKLVIDSVLFKCVITLVSVMTSNMVLVPTLVVIFKFEFDGEEYVRGLEDRVRCNI